MADPFALSWLTLPLRNGLQIEIKSHPCKEVEKLPHFNFISSVLGGRTKSLLAIAVSKEGRGSDTFFDG